MTKLCFLHFKHHRNAIDGMKPAGNKGGEKKVAGGVASALAIGVSVDRNPDRRDTGAT